MDEKLFEQYAYLGLIKSVDKPIEGMDSAQKAHLNRRGNELFNLGKIDTARRIFQTTGYSDGLIRIGEKYLENGNPVDALKMFELAHDKNRCTLLVEKAAFAIRKLLEEEESNE